MNNIDSEGNKLSKEQMEYFKNSKIIDDSGNLLVVYHGTSSDVIDSFNKDRIGERSGKSHLQFGSGFYFTQYSGSASFYGNVFEFYLNICNPYIVNTNGYKEYQDEFILNFKQHLVDDFNLIEFKNNLDNLVGDDIQSVLINNGYDGIVYGPEYIIAFEPNQIKAITNRKPTTHDNINESLTEVLVKLLDGFRYNI